MHSIAQIGDHIARAEFLDDETEAVRLKALRNLTQRLPIRASGKRGRADLYDTPTAAAIRLVDLAREMGIGRAVLHDFTLLLGGTDMLAPVAQGSKPTVAERMVARARAGEQFEVTISRSVDGRIAYAFGHPRSTVEDDAFGWQTAAVFSLRASGLICDLIADLEG